ncbi:exodeoxyribonuclease VII small subunit [Candidatus Obscuribacterales bacterium]|nr:exodeoxyribonuclease VII small subunit [Candidatus Obscuribacterales bacterium]MBX3137332.1 exodeoxyribonuclease VII small subunit [Candidatus Obscuribacterales bacterium]MBX3152973.1 exodeoxyribonuclease VII small subunit [Candidatus Obscuribacterales bacterium]
MDKPIDFEIAMRDLETVVSELDGEVKLEQALALFEQGMKLSKQCEEFLKGAEQKIEMLKRGDQGELIAMPVSGETLEAVTVASAATPVRVEKEETVKEAKTKKAQTAATNDSGELMVKESEQLSFFSGTVVQVP